MKRFIIKLTLFILPIVIIATSVEIYNRRNNTFYAKKQYVDKNQNAIEVMFLGSSQTWRAINPAFLTFKCAPLAHGESAFNIDYLLFNQYINNLPKLKVLVLETSYHTFEDYRDHKWNKNHLFWIYYGINNYEKNAPMSDYFMISSNPKEYLKKLWTSSIFPEFGQYNEFGYITSANKTLATGAYDPEFLKNRHAEENLTNFKINSGLLEKIIATCKEKNIEIVFFSPPKFSTYNKNNNLSKLNRRDSLLSIYKNNGFVNIWNYEKAFENDSQLFYNEDHLNINGSKKLTQEINVKLNEIIKKKSSNTNQ